ITVEIQVTITITDPHLFIRWRSGGTRQFTTGLITAGRRTAKRSSIPTGTAGPTRVRWTHFVERDFPIAIFIEALQSRGRVGDFLFVNYSVMIRVERRE